MAETRKYDPAAGNAIAQALRAAMGDPIRPATPGQPAEAKKPAESPSETTTSWLSFTVTGDQADIDD